ncbi:MAG: radical SAM/SPASM domain-containing protein [Bacteroidia bacterium]|nr:radical SAM/SPASM domain-containing protein [Bacteroidia bacterium]
MNPYRKTLLLSQTLTPRKVQNFLRIGRSFYYSRYKGQSFHRGNPVKIGVEPTTSCNLRCPECPSGLRAFTRPTGMLGLDLHREVIDQLYKDLVFLLLYFQGEPYLNPKFLDMAAYAREKNIYSATSTNGHYLTEEKARLTVESGLSEVLISIDGTTQETYQSYRVGGKLEKVKEGVRNLVEARKRAGTLYPFIVIQFLVVRPNEHQIADIKRLGKELGVDAVVFKTAQVYDYENGNDLIPTLEKYSRYRQGSDGKFHLKNRLDNQCWKLWHGAEITWDGKVLPCCFDKDAQYEMGNLQTASFESIWRSEAYHRFRNQLLRSRSEIEMCRNCSEGTQIFA